MEREVRAMRGTTRTAAFLGSLLTMLLLAAATAQAATPHVVVMPVTGIVDQVMAGYVHDGIASAASGGASAVVLEIDTPGGSLDSMRTITQDILGAPIPVITWVAPQGAWAASAGTFITMAGAVAVMAPGTNIGAASPVGSGGQDITGTEGAKVMSFTISSITAIAEARGRSVSWAVAAVQDAKSSSATEAVSAGAVDGIAGTLDEVLAFASGRPVKGSGGPYMPQLVGATVQQLPMNPWQQLLHLLADPNLAFILFVLGAYGLILEFVHPNLVTGALGGVSLILAFLGFGSLPLNLAGLLLIVLALVLFVTDMTVTSHGLLTLAGLGCFVLGAAALYTQPGTFEPGVSVAWPVIGAMVLVTGLFMFVVVAAAWRIRHRLRLPLGLGGSTADGTVPVPAGMPASVRRPLQPIGTVYAGGEEWSARSADGGALDRGARVRVVGQDGLILLVERADPSGPADVEVSGR
jgi:membrane-bound serine protease (ClpP class)